MQKYNKIFSLFFLSIFSMFMLHQVLPHMHHEHEDSINHLENQLHSHEQEHHHHDDEKSTNDFDFFEFLLGNHSHSIQVESFPSIRHAAKQQVIIKDICSDFLSDQYLTWIVNSCKQKSIFGDHTPDYFCNLYLSTSFLRGPPSLG